MTNEIKTIEDAKALGLKTHAFNGGYWQYADTNNKYHLMKGGKDLTKTGMAAYYVDDCGQRSWTFLDKKGDIRLVMEKQNDK